MEILQEFSRKKITIREYKMFLNCDICIYSCVESNNLWHYMSGVCTIFSQRNSYKYRETTDKINDKIREIANNLFFKKNSKFVFFSYIICTLILIIFPFWKFQNTSCFHFGIDILEEQKKIINIRLNWMGSWIINFYNNLWNIISFEI